MRMNEDYIWYVSIGSNTDFERFMRYIAGGNLPNNTREYPPCVDTSEPLASRAVEIDRPLWFGGESLAWGGGVAHLGCVAGPEVTLGRAYLIKLLQLEHVVEQETRTAKVNVVLGDLITNGSIEILNAMYYDRVIYLGNLDGRPMAALATSRPPEYGPPRKPYLARVAHGLCQAGFDPNMVAGYLAGNPGISGAYTRDDIIAIINEVNSARKPRAQKLGSIEGTATIRN
jgi:hypothetical protein